jgi:hypothetical protein
VVLEQQVLKMIIVLVLMNQDALAEEAVTELTLVL